MGNICNNCDKERKKSTAVIIEPTTADNNKSMMPSAQPTSSNTSNSNACNSDGSPPLNHLLKISEQHSLNFDPQIRIDFSKKEYRAFCLLIHKKEGAVLLHCTKKRRKPPHYQLPGGNVDGYEFKQVTKSFSSWVTQEQLYLATRIGCAREVYEETGMDFRSQLDRFLPMVLYSNNMEEIYNKSKLINEYKSRIFFVCDVFDNDFPCASRNGLSRFSTIRYPSVPNNYTCDLLLQLSEEHSGFRFFKESLEISRSLNFHSGGKVTKAVEMAFNTKAFNDK